MLDPTPPRPHPPLLPGTPAFDALVSHAGDVKGQLVDFAFSGRFRAEWEEFHSDPLPLDHSTASLTMDTFVLQYRLPRGGTIVERFVSEQRRLSRADRAMLLGWREVVQSVFEVLRVDQGVEVHSLVDDLPYQVFATMGPSAYAPVSAGAFLIGRIVPLGHGTDVWLLSGNPTLIPADAGAAAAEAALTMLTGNPEALGRNPSLLRRAWEVQGIHREQFIAEFGSDVVVLPTAEVEQALRGYHQRLRDNAGTTAGELGMEEVGLDTLSALSEELRGVETIGLVFDEQDGLCYYGDFAGVDAFFEDPEGAGRPGVNGLLAYLEDDSVAPSAIRHLVRRHPDTADMAFRMALGKPGFSWDADGTRLLRRYKRRAMRRDPMPATSVLGERLLELLRSSSTERPTN